MLVLLFGATGWIGGQMRKLMREIGWDVLDATSRLEDTEEVARDLDTFKPQAVVNAAGLTGRPNIDALETQKVQTTRVNVVGAVSLAAECEARGIYLATFATGCIYEYDAAHVIGGTPFTETDAPNFTGSYYSRTKIAAEVATREFDHHLILRVRMPITCDASPRCFVTKIANYARVVDVPNSVTVLPDLLPVAVQLIADRVTGVHNFVSPGPVSHSQILDAYREIVDPSFTYEVMDMEAHDKVVKARRSNNALDTTKLETAAGRALPDALTSIRGLFAKHRPVLRK